MKILILTLTGQRDKVVDEILGEKLREYGHEVYVQNYLNAGRQSVPYLKPDVVIVPMVGGQFKLDFVEQCKKWGCVVIVRRGEAGASREVFEKMEPDRQDIVLGHWDYSQYVDLELTWGQEFTDILVENGKMPEDKLQACGGFSFDAYFRSESKHVGLNYKTILFATGWSCADGKPELVECGLPEDSEYQTVLYNRHRAGRDVWISAIKKMVTLFPEWRFTLKVRPGERVDEYVRELDGVDIYPQMTPAIDALRETDVLVHTGSTMAIEAHLMGIPSFNFHNINPDALLAHVSPRVETVEELEWVLIGAERLVPNINDMVYDELREHLYGEIDGNACGRAASFVHAFIDQREIKTNIPNVWPRVVKYEDNISDIRIFKPLDDDHQWVCPACHERYYSTNTILELKCPFCGMVIERTNLANRKKGVLA